MLKTKLLELEKEQREFKTVTGKARDSGWQMARSQKRFHLRYLNLARAFLRQTPYRKLEAKCLEKVVPGWLLQRIQMECPTEVLENVSRWLDASTP